jgi:hypothetical protein
MGVYPQSFLSFFTVTVSQMVQQHQARCRPPLGSRGLMNWELVLPELVLACAGLAILLFGVFRERDMTFPCAMA